MPLADAGYGMCHQNCGQSYLPSTYPVSQGAEVTCLWLQRKGETRYWNLLTVIEEVAAGQAWSPELFTEDEKGRRYPLKRQALGGDVTLYGVRTRLYHPDESKTLFYSDAGKRSLTVGGDRVFINSVAQETEEVLPGEILIGPKDDVPMDQSMSPLQWALPTRCVSSQVRVCLVPGADFSGWLGEERLDKVFGIAKAWMGIELDRARELLGSFLWSRPNPWMRAMRWAVTRDGRTLRIESYPRPGVVIPPMRVTVWSDTQLGRRALFQMQWHGGAVSCPLPDEVGQLGLQVHSETGEALEERQATFVKEINISMRVSAGEREVALPMESGITKSRRVPRWHMGTESRVGQSNSTEQWLRSHIHERERDERKRRGEFAYFGAFEQKTEYRAQEYVRGLIGKAHRRCIVADPYLGAGEVYSFALFVQSLEAKIQLLGGEEHLHRSAGNGKTHGRALCDEVEKLQAQDRAFTPEVWVLKGRKRCPLHDRFLVVDDTVYHLGGSLNHIGARAMAISRVPTPEPVMSDLERWLAGQCSERLEEWLARHDY